MGGAQFDGLQSLQSTTRQLADKWRSAVTFTVGTNVKYAAKCMPHRPVKGGFQNRAKSGKATLAP